MTAIPHERSQSQTRLRSLAETLNAVQTANKQDFENAQKQLDTRLSTLQQKVEKTLQTDQQKFALLTDQLQKLFAAQAAEKGTRDLMSQRKGKEIELVESSFAQTLDTEERTREDSRAKLIQMLQDRIIACTNDFVKLHDEGDKMHDVVFKYMREHVGKIITQMTDARTETDQMYRDFNVALDQQVYEIRSMILKESQDAESQQATFTDTFKKVCQMLQSKLAVEREARELKEEQILNLLEQITIRQEEYIE